MAGTALIPKRQGDDGIVRVCPTPSPTRSRLARIAQLAAERRHAERELACWQLAAIVMRGAAGSNPRTGGRTTDAFRGFLSGDRGELMARLADDSNQGKKRSEFFLVIRPHQAAAD